MLAIMAKSSILDMGGVLKPHLVTKTNEIIKLWVNSDNIAWLRANIPCKLKLGTASFFLKAQTFLFCFHSGAVSPSTRVETFLDKDLAS